MGSRIGSRIGNLAHQLSFAAFARSNAASVAVVSPRPSMTKARMASVIQGLGRLRSLRRSESMTTAVSPIAARTHNPDRLWAPTDEPSDEPLCVPGPEPLHRPEPEHHPVRGVALEPVIACDERTIQPPLEVVRV